MVRAEKKQAEDVKDNWTAGDIQRMRLEVKDWSKGEALELCSLIQKIIILFCLNNDLTVKVKINMRPTCHTNVTQIWKLRTYRTEKSEHRAAAPWPLWSWVFGPGWGAPACGTDQWLCTWPAPTGYGLAHHRWQKSQCPPPLQHWKTSDLRPDLKSRNEKSEDVELQPKLYI